MPLEEPLPSTYSMQIAPLDCSEIDGVALSCQAPMPASYDNMQYSYQGHHNNLNELFQSTIDFRASSSDERFARMLQEMHEAPSDRLPKDLLADEKFSDGSSTFLHYVAAKGRVDNVMKDVLDFCLLHRHRVDEASATCSAALHVAVQYDRFSNVMLLVDAGARTDLVDNAITPGELPLHVAIRTSKTPQLVAYLLKHNRQTATRRVQKPSEREGEVAVDLAIGRLLQDLADADRDHSSRISTDILQEVLTSLNGERALKDTRHLLAHARRDSHLFLQAIAKVEVLSHSQRLKETMLAVFGESEMQKHGLAFMCNQKLMSEYTSLTSSRW